jgi:hypothetical protein
MVALFGLLVALSMLIIIALVSSDDGLPTASTVQEGLVIFVIIAAVPLAVIFGLAGSSRVAILGGAMTAAGFATMFGGNFAGLAMAIGGVPIMVWGASRGVKLSLGHLARLIGYTTLLVAAMWLSLGVTTLLMKTIAVLLAGIVAVAGLQPSGTASTTA